MKKKLLIFVLSVSLLFGATQSKAVLPLLGAIGLVDAGGAITAAGWTLIIGAPSAFMARRIGDLMLETDKDGDGQPEYIRLPTTRESRDRPVAVPDVPSSTPESPSSTSSVYSCPSTSNLVYTGGYVNGSPTNWACQSTKTGSGSYSSGSCTYTYTYSGWTGTGSNAMTYAEQPCSSLSTSPNTVTGISPTLTCNSGYTLSGSSCLRNAETPPCGVGYTSNGSGVCVLSEPEKIPDKNCDLKVSSSGGATYITNNTDPDCGGLMPVTPDGKFQLAFQANLSPDGVQPAKPYNIIMGAGFWSFPPTLTDGLPSVGNSLTATFQPADASEPAKSVKFDLVDGVVTGVSSQTVSGNIATAGTTYVNSAGQTVTVGANDLVMVVPNATGAYTVAPAGTASLSIPTDYARTGEFSTALNPVVDALRDTPLDSATPAASINASLDALNDNLTPKNEDQPQIDFSWLPSLLPGTYTACVPFTFSMNPTTGAAAGMSGIGEVDICDKLDLARQILGWLIGVVTAFYIFRVFVQSNKAAL